MAIENFKNRDFPEAPDLYEQAAQMKYVEGKTWAQIAKALDLSRGSLDALKRRLRRDMKKVILIMAIIKK